MAARSEADICGLILVAAPGRRLGDILRAQLRANPANGFLLDQAFAAIARLESGSRVEATALHPALLPLLGPPIQSFLIDAFSHDPADLLRGFGKPVLIMQGTGDIQVGEADARRLAEAHPGATQALLPGVNHVLKRASADDRAANLATYGDPTLPLAPGVVDTVADLIAAHANP